MSSETQIDQYNFKTTLKKFHSYVNEVIEEEFEG